MPPEHRIAFSLIGNPNCIVDEAIHAKQAHCNAQSIEPTQLTTQQSSSLFSYSISWIIQVCHAIQEEWNSLTCV